MFVQALAEYADSHLQKELNDVAFEERPIPYLLDISQDGRFLAAIPKYTEEILPAKKGGKPKTIRRPMTHSVPRSPVNRNSGLYPLLAADDIKYVLGVGAWSKLSETANHAERHKAFVALIAGVAAETSDEALVSCAKFYARPAEVEKARIALAEAAPGSNVALSVDGAVVDREAVQVWWRKAFERAAAERSSVEVAECLISGVVGSIPPTHPKIKHTSALGGQAAGVSLMSFDKGAFRSYGWEQCANSPVSSDRAMAYVLALNNLLKPRSSHRKDFDGVAFLFWLRRQADDDIDPFTMAVDPDPEDVKRLLDLERPSQSMESEPDPNLFYMAAVSANGSRLILRSWVTEKLPVVKENLRSWFDGLRIQPWGANRVVVPPPMWQLLQALDREGKPTAGRVVALLRRALEGPQRPLGNRILQDILQRMKVDPEKRTNLPSLGLLRVCVNDLQRVPSQGETMSESLDPNLTHPAYLCGRLLALHDSLQWKTFDTAGESQPNSTVADRFYSLVMTSPSVGMEKVFTLGRKHLHKLRRLNPKAAFAFEQQVGNLEDPLGGNIPRSFGMHDKARFALGFYHQKAYRPKTAMEAGTANDTEHPNPTEKESDQ